MRAVHEPAARPRPACTDDSLRELLVRVRPRALWLLGRYRIPAADAEDLMQQTVLAFLIRHEEVREPEAWVLGTLRNQCLRFWRLRRQRAVEPLEESLGERLAAPEPAEHELADLRHDLELALARLPERCRTVLRHRYGLGFRATELAELLDRPAATVRKLASRCLRALARELEVAGEPAAEPVGEGGPPRRNRELASILHREESR